MDFKLCASRFQHQKGREKSQNARKGANRSRSFSGRRAGIEAIGFVRFGAFGQFSRFLMVFVWHRLMRRCNGSNWLNGNKLRSAPKLLSVTHHLETQSTTSPPS